MANIYKNNGSAALKAESGQAKLRVIRGTNRSAVCGNPQVHARVAPQELRDNKPVLSDRASEFCLAAFGIFSLFFLSFGTFI